MATKKSGAKKASASVAAPDAGDLTLEQKKAAGLTAAQQELKEYHETTFQTQDPITGEDRDLDEHFPIARLDRGETIEDITPQDDA